LETTDYTDKESEISADNKPQRHGGTKIMKQGNNSHKKNGNNSPQRRKERKGSIF